MNSKSEFHQPSIVRVSTNLGNSNEEQTSIQSLDGARGRRGSIRRAMSRGNRSRGARSRGARSRRASS